MDVAIFHQTAAHLTHKTRHWDRRLRLITSLIWLPRGLIGGVLIGLVVTTMAWLRPLLMPEQLAFIAGQEAFFGITSGEAEDKYGWLTPVN